MPAAKTQPVGVIREDSAGESGKDPVNNGKPEHSPENPQGEGEKEGSHQRELRRQFQQQPVNGQCFFQISPPTVPCAAAIKARSNRVSLSARPDASSFPVPLIISKPRWKSQGLANRPGRAARRFI